MRFENEKALFDQMEKLLNTAVICDILDDFGYRSQIMDHTVRPLDPEHVIAGRAMTILAADVCNMPDVPYEMEIAAVDSIKQDEVVVTATNRSNSNAFWGELLSTAAVARGARGAIIDGGTRDVKKIAEVPFKVFASAINPLDSKGRCIVIEYGSPVVCGGLKVLPGQIIFADFDGIVAIPREVEDKVISAAMEKIAKERDSLNMLRTGALLREVFDKYGIL